MTNRFPLIFLAAVALPGVAVAQTGGSAVTGAKLFGQCRICHTAGPAEPNGIGPNLTGVVGAKAAARPGYAYSPALKAATIVWTPAVLDAWLKRPAALVPGTKMAFAGVAAPQARADLIAYLVTLKPPRH